MSLSGKKLRKFKGIALIPTLLTIGNGVSGFAAVVYASQGLFTAAAWAIFLGMFFDAMDGTAARMVKSTSPFGAQLDSLCDVITFGLAPSYMVFVFMTSHTASHIYPSKIIWILSALFMSCAILRLAKFNIDNATVLDKHLDFAGLPTPGAAGGLASIFLLYASLPDTSFFIRFDVLEKLLPFYIISLALLMISTVKYAHIGTKLFQMNYKFKNLVELILIVFLVALQPEMSLCLTFLLYISSGPIKYIEELIRNARISENAERKITL